MAVASPREAVELLNKAFFTPGEVAALASVSSSTILNYIHDGRLAAVKLSERTYRIPRKAVVRLLGLEAPSIVVTERPDVAVDL